MIVDTREDDKIFRLLEKLKQPYTKQQLPIGDYLEETKNIVVERKTVEDFLGSYVSGHLSEQLTNLESNFDEYYLFISGNFKNLFFQPLPQQLKHITVESYIKMRIHLLRSFKGLRIVEFDNDTQLLKGVVELFTYEGSKKIDRIVRMRSTKEDVNLAMIAVVPGIGIERAKRLLKVVHTPFRLVHMTETDLKNIDGIGDVYAKRIKEYFKEESQ